MSFIDTISILESKKWNNIVRSFSDHDIYYLSNYLKAFQIHGDGEPELLYYNSSDLRGIYAIMKRDIALFDPFKNILPTNSYFDIITPYGYGGFIFEGNTSHDNLLLFNKVYSDFLKSKNIISDFTRFHPLLNNQNYFRKFSSVIDLGKTISIELQSPAAIWNNFSGKNKNIIRKAKKNNIEIKHGKDWSVLEEFIKIYNSMLKRNNADPYYYFNKNFFNSVKNDLHNNYEIFYACCDNQIISASIILYANNKMHYHLSGTLHEYRSLAPTNLLLYEASCWGIEQGFSSFHLGGGLGSREDNLFLFKKAFNKKEDHQFSIGKRIPDNNAYLQLVELRRKTDSSFNINEQTSFFPLYRFTTQTKSLIPD